MTAPVIAVAGDARVTKERIQEIAYILLDCDGATLIDPPSCGWRGRSTHRRSDGCGRGKIRKELNPAAACPAVGSREASPAARPLTRRTGEAAAKEESEGLKRMVSRRGEPRSGPTRLKGARS